MCNNALFLWNFSLPVQTSVGVHTILYSLNGQFISTQNLLLISYYLLWEEISGLSPFCQTFENIRAPSSMFQRSFVLDFIIGINYSVSQ